MGRGPPVRAGLGGGSGNAEKDVVGERSLARPGRAARDRKQLVGLLTVDPKIVLEEGAQIVAAPNQPIPMTMLGHVTSSYWSTTLDRSIALALVRGGRARIGKQMSVPMPNGAVAVELVEPIFYDPKGARLDA